MLSILSNTRDIYFNLALEEFLLKKKTEDFFMLWQSETSVVVGKHQNTWAEINHTYIRQNNIRVARRLSGGGTVYHGAGNLNFTFIMNGEPGKMVNFQKFVTPVIDYLKTLGLEAEIGNHNDLLIKGIKISGNAEHIFKQRVLHHGTLLFDANLIELAEAIKIVPGRYADKAVQSNRSNAGNIVTFLKHSLSMEDFTTELNQFIRKYYQIKNNYSLNGQELDIVNTLRKEKYSTTEWIYFYSPPFQVHIEARINGQHCELVFYVEKGLIKEVTINNSFATNTWNNLLERFTDIPFDYYLIKEIFEASGRFTDSQITEIMQSLF